MKYSNLFINSNETTIVDNLNDFLKLPKNKQIYTMISDRALAPFPIKECNEPLLPLKKYLYKHNSPIQLAAGQTCYGAQSLGTQKLRLGAAERLLKAEKILESLNAKLTFKITDSYRPISLQKKYYDEITAQYATTGLSGNDLYLKVVQVISDPAFHPPHSTGGTLDLTLVEKKTGYAIDMGTKVDEINDPHIATFHQDISSPVGQNRLMLYTAMIEAGFVNSPSEWWHYTYGTQEWAARLGYEHAIYDIL